jgi:3-hydroxybutyrate dehydrogenase
LFDHLKGKTALVTGSTSGIGLATARRLASVGCNLVLNGFGDAGDIAAIVKEMTGTHRIEAFHHGADMAKPADIPPLFDEAQKRFGGVDILINNAGISHVAPIETFPAERWEQIIAINLSAAFYTTKSALPGMYARGWGRIVNIASTHGLVADPGRSAYVASKHGLIGLTKVIALEGGPHGVTCNAISPGYIMPGRLEKQIAERAVEWGISMEDAVKRWIGNKHATLRATSTDQVADAVLYLCSNAAANVTGITLPIDGGWTAQ